MTAISRTRELVEGVMPTAYDELGDLVAIHSEFSADPALRAACRDAADYIRERLRALGFDDARAQETVDESVSVIARRTIDPQAPTVLLYSHFDVQPPGPDEEWDTPPFELTRVGDRLFGRGAADCKGGVVAHLAALRAAADTSTVNVLFVSEGSEERGGRGLDDWIRTHPDEFAGISAALILDAANPAPGTPAIVTSLRGVVVARVTLRAGTRDLHSGSFGGAAPDTAMALVKLLATLRDDAGDTTIDGMPQPAMWDGAAYPESAFRLNAGLPDTAAVIGSGDVATQLWARPALTVLAADLPGMDAPSPSILPQASAMVSLRVPPSASAAASAVLLEQHLRARAVWGAGVDVEVVHISEPFRSAPDGVARRALADALTEAHGRETVAVGDGGSIPLCATLQEAAPDAEVLLFGISEPGSRIHAPNESVVISDLEAVIVAEALFLERYGQIAGRIPR